jgi:hypothetical protein
MTVSTTANREQYATDGITTAFAIHSPFFEETDIKAIVVDALGNATVLVLGAHYLVSGGDGSGGTLTMTAAPAAGGSLTLYRELPFTQEADYVEDDPLPAATLEGGFDRAVMRDQQLKDGQDRALTFPVTIAPGVSAELPNPQAGTVLGWNATADRLENMTLAGGPAVYSSIANTQAGIASAEAATPDAVASLWQQGANIASAATLAKPSDINLGGYYFLTGATNVANGWAGERPGRSIKLHVVTGGFSLVHGANWKNKGNANILTAADDSFEMIVGTDGIWRMQSYNKADGTPLASGSIAISFSANKGGVDQNFATGTLTKITFTTEDWDVGGYYDAVNSKFIPPAGKYLLTVSLGYSGGLVDQSPYVVYIYKNGSAHRAATTLYSGTGVQGFTATIAAVVDANGSDFFEAYAAGQGTGTKTVNGVTALSYMTGARLGSTV